MPNKTNDYFNINCNHFVRHYHQTDRVLVVGNCRYLMNLFLIPVQFLKFEYPSGSWHYAYCLMGYKLTINNIDIIRSVMVICWHRAKIEIFLKTLEKLPGTSQVLG